MSDSCAFLWWQENGGEEEVLTSELLSNLSFLHFLSLWGIYVCQLGLSCGCVLL